jgi:hypothetical protein
MTAVLVVRLVLYAKSEKKKSQKTENVYEKK